MTISRWLPVLPDLYLWKSNLRGRQHPVNSYLWRRRDGVVLIDPAADLDASALRAIGAEKVADILITHAQEENLAGSFHFPRARIHFPAGDEYLAAGRKAYLDSIENWLPPWDWSTRGILRGNLAGAPNERPPRRPLRLDTPLVAGSMTAGLRVLSTPGHGKHAVTLIAQIAGKRVGFSGDLVHGRGQLWNWFDCDWDYGNQKGQWTLKQSVARLKRERLDLLCPTHGDVVRHPEKWLATLGARLAAVLHKQGPATAPINFPEKDSPARGSREIFPCLHQWRTGNCAVLISRTGNALMVDDGLCHWVPFRERTAHHKAVIRDWKRSLGIRKIEIVIPTHYHGDHTENIPDLIAMEGSEVVGLDLVSGPIEHPERYPLVAPLPWYGTRHGRFNVDRKLANGACLRWHEFELEIFHLGGQTWYELGVAVNIHGVRTLFVGDGIGRRSAICDPVLCYNKADPETGGWLFAIERMIEHKPDLLVCGHGAATRNPMPLLKRMRNAWKRRVRKFRSLSARSDLRQFFDPFL